jgi:ATP-dependent Clp protease ATP-binding subunit ClpC
VYPFERFSDDAKRVLTLAQSEAERSRHSYIGTEHILLALLQAGNETTRRLNELGVDEARAREMIDRVVRPEERPVIQQIIPTSRVKRTIELAFAVAEAEAVPLVTPRHLLVALMEEGQGIAVHVLEDLGVTLDTMRADGEGGG